MGHQFRVLTDQQALKYLLEQRVGTPFQQKWVAKLLGFDFIVEYRCGKENRAADALSRQMVKENDSTIQEYQDDTVELHALSVVQATWWEDLQQAYTQDPQLQQLLIRYNQGDLDSAKYKLQRTLLFYKGRLHLGTLKDYQNLMLKQYHGSSIGGHTGTLKTYARIKREFFWNGMRNAVRNFIRECDVCQCNKTENLKPAGLLQPLPIPEGTWKDISMDFI